MIFMVPFEPTASLGTAVMVCNLGRIKCFQTLSIQNHNISQIKMVLSLASTSKQVCHRQQYLNAEVQKVDKLSCHASFNRAQNQCTRTQR